MRYLKDLGKISLFVIAIYVPAFILLSQSSVDRMNEIRNRDYAARLERTKSNFENLVTTGRYTEACIRMAAEYDGKYIESYRLLTPELECYQPKAFTEFPPIEANSGAHLLNFNGNDHTFVRFKIGDVDWAYSVLTLPNLTYFGWLKKDKLVRESFYELLMLVVYIIFAFVFFSVIVAVDTIKSKFRKNGTVPIWLKFFDKTFGLLQLGDLQILKSASRRLIDLKNTLELERDVLQRSLEHTILTEIRANNHKVPYTFTGTVAKVDINGFSKIVAEGARQASFEMSTVLENIGCELLQRYGGLFEKTVGDEIVVVFRGDDSHLKAVAFVRDLMQAFSELSFSVYGETRRFTLKGSIANSSITFCKRAAGYGFLGDAFTITSRLLEAVTDKDRNILSVLEVDSDKIHPLAKLPKEKVSFKFKNMNAMEGYFVNEFNSFQEVNSTSRALYFLSDNVLMEQIKLVPTIENFAEREAVMNNITNIVIRLTTANFAETIMNTLREVVAKPKTQEWNRTLSRLITAAASLIPTEQWLESYSSELLAIPLDREGRVNAAILQVLMVKDPNKLNLINTDSFIIPRDPSHRTRGQILIALSRHSLNEKLIVQIISMINSRNENESATGVFVGCDVINYYWKDDSAGFTILDNSTDLINLLMKRNSDGGRSLSDRLKSYLSQTISMITKSNESAEQESVA